MKYNVDCPECGLYTLKFLADQETFKCAQCGSVWTEVQLLKHMQHKPGLDPHAPAFWRLGVKPKGKSAAAKAVFG